jgi:hypothetical protein
MKRRRITQNIAELMSPITHSSVSTSSLTENSDDIAQEVDMNDTLTTPPSKVNISKVCDLAPVSKNCKSWVWNYFKPYAKEHSRNDTVVCMLCLDDRVAKLESDTPISSIYEINIGKERGTSNMVAHIKYNHKSIYLEHAKTLIPDDESQSSILKHVTPTSTFPSALKEWIIQDLQPLRIVESKAFRAMIAAANTKCKIPCRNTLTTGRMYY